MASFNCERAADFCRQFSTSNPFKPRQQFARDLLHFGAFLARQFRCRPRQDVEDDQFFLAHVLAHMAFLLVVQAVGELHQFREQFLDAAAAGVVAFDQRLELLGEVGAGAVQPDHLFQLGADRGLEHFEVGVLVLRFLEALRQRLEVDLRQVERRRP